MSPRNATRAMPAVMDAPCRAPLTLSVGGVCGGIPRCKMAGVDATASASTWAPVEQIYFGKHPRRELPGNAMGCLRLWCELPTTEDAVSASIEVSGPQPTLTGLVHSCPKRFLPGAHHRGRIARMSTELPLPPPGVDASNKEQGTAMSANSLNFSHEEILT